MFALPSWVYTGVLALALAGAGVWYFNWSQTKLEEQNAVISEQQTALIQTQRTLDTIQADMEQNREKVEALDRRMSAAEQGREDLLEKLRSHDLERLSAAKPGLIERRVNEATKEVFDDFERITTPGGVRENGSG